MRRRDFRRTALGLACAGLLLAAAPAFAQRQSSFGTSGSFNSTNILGGNTSGNSSNSFFGGTSSFGNSMTSGNSVFGGNTFMGGTPGATTTGRQGATQIGATSFLGAYYANPLAMGLTSATGTTQTTQNFGTALYNLNSSTTRSGTATISTGNRNEQFGVGVNVRRLPSYATTLKIKDLPPPLTAEQVRTDVQSMLAASPELDPRDSVRVLTDGPAVVLQGRVVDDDERRLVENMVRISVGVGEIRNELKTGTQ